MLFKHPDDPNDTRHKNDFRFFKYNTYYLNIQMIQMIQDKKMTPSSSNIIPRMQTETQNTLNCSRVFSETPLSIEFYETWIKNILNN
jgi:hypothetical protein